MNNLITFVYVSLNPKPMHRFLSILLMVFQLENSLIIFRRLNDLNSGHNFLNMKRTSLLQIIHCLLSLELSGWLDNHRIRLMFSWLILWVCNRWSSNGLMMSRWCINGSGRFLSVLKWYRDCNTVVSAGCRNSNLWCEYWFRQIFPGCSNWNEIQARIVFQGSSAPYLQTYESELLVFQKRKLDKHFEKPPHICVRIYYLYILSIEESRLSKFSDI